jgi:sugar/nucleoside kinase (ribokinase family)
MFNGVFLGLVTADIVYYVPHYPSSNQKLKAELQLAFAGGPAANSAVSFAAFGNKASLISGLGRHPLARVAMKDLADHHVQLIDCTDQPKRPPVLASIVIDLSNYDRSVVYSNADLRKLGHDALSEVFLEDADILMLDGHFLPQAIQMAQWAKPRHIPVVFDCGGWRDGMEELLPLADYAICSNDFYPPGCTSKADVIAHLRSYGIENIAITWDGNPIIIHHQGNTTEMPVMKIRPMDPLGAGDIFQGTFCHHILKNDFLFSIERAAEVASMSCTSLGTRAWIEQEKFI